MIQFIMRFFPFVNRFFQHAQRMPKTDETAVSLESSAERTRTAARAAILQRLPLRESPRRVSTRKRPAPETQHRSSAASMRKKIAGN